MHLYPECITSHVQVTEGSITSSPLPLFISEKMNDAVWLNCLSYEWMSSSWQRDTSPQQWWRRDGIFGHTKRRRRGRLLVSRYHSPFSLSVFFSTRYVPPTRFMSLNYCCDGLSTKEGRKLKKKRVWGAVRRIQDHEGGWEHIKFTVRRCDAFLLCF